MMRWVLPALLMSAVLASGQDGAPQAREWCDKLSDDEPQVREQAQKELVKIGAAAIPALKDAAEKSTDPEVRDRARKAMDEIARAEKLERVYTPPKRVTIDFKNAPLRQVVEELGRQSGLRFTISGHQATPVSIKATDQPLLWVLDELSKQLKDSTFRFADEKSVTLSTDRFIPYPSTYSGAFRLRVTRIEKQVSNSFEKVSGEIRLSLVVDWEKTIKPLENYQIDILEACDDQNQKLNLQERVDDPNQVQWRGAFRRMAAPQMAPQENWVTFPEIDPGVKSLNKVRARGTFRFPLDIQQVSFTDPKAEDARSAGDYTVKIQSVDRNYIMINVSCKSELAAQNLSETFDFGSFEIIDKNGNVSKTEVASSGIVDQRTFQFYAMTRRVAVKEFRFNLREIVSKTFDFEFDSLELPR